MFFFKDSIFKEPLNLLSSFDHIWGPCYLRETNYNDQINLILGPLCCASYSSFTTQTLIFLIAYVYICAIAFHEPLYLHSTFWRKAGRRVIQSTTHDQSKVIEIEQTRISWQFRLPHTQKQGINKGKCIFCFTVIGIILISLLFVFFEILIGTTCSYTWRSCQSHLQTLVESLQSPVGPCLSYTGYSLGCSLLKHNTFHSPR